MAVSQDQLALRPMAADPTKIKRIAFGDLDCHRVAGWFLPDRHPAGRASVGREYIGRVDRDLRARRAPQSLPGTVIAAMLPGIVESITATFYGPSWAPAVAFGFLLLTLAFRPAGLLGR